MCISVCFWGDGTAGVARVKVNRPKCCHVNRSVCVIKTETESDTERKKEEKKDNGSLLVPDNAVRSVKSNY